MRDESMTIDTNQIKRIFEGALMAADEPLSVSRLARLIDKELCPETKILRQILSDLAEEYSDRAVELKEVASGYRFQIRVDLAPSISKLWEERPPRYSRALLETLALIAYKQPITRAEIEDVRGVAVSTNIIRTLLEREWVRVVGHKDVPGKPALYATSKQFLDYFNLKTLRELPELAEISDPDDMVVQLELDPSENEQVEQVEEVEVEMEVEELEQPEYEAPAEIEVIEE